MGNLSSNTYHYATDVQEVRRCHKGVTGEDISLERRYLTPDGKIGGLPEKAANPDQQNKRQCQDRADKGCIDKYYRT